MIIGLTGGIGSGKSTALRALKENGYETVSCDEITRDLYRCRKTLKRLKAEFPSAISGVFRLKADKKEIARIVFSDKEKHRFLTDLFTRETFKIAMRRAEKLVKNGGTVIVEVPLLLENDLQNAFDEIIVIARDKTARIESVKTRSALSDEEVSARLAAQVDYDALDLSAYTVIKNDGTKEDLAAAVLKAVKDF